MKKGLIAIIPARGQSKGIPKKNIARIGGKPLIAHTIEAALKSREFEHVFVSSEDKQILETAKKFGAETIKRPKEFAGDTSPTIDAVKHLVKHLEEEKKYSTDSIVLLQPTSPLRNHIDIKKAVKLFYESGKKNVVSVSEPHKSPYLAVKIEENKVQPVFGWEYHHNIRRQDLPKTFLVNGAIYAATVENILKFNNFFGETPLPYVMTQKQGMDVDTKTDLEIIDFLIQAKNKRGRCN